MGVINIIKNIKQIHEKDIVLIRVGKFYYSYGKDAYILSYVFQYKLTKIEGENTCSCAFPEQSYRKITAQLENKKINYIIVDFLLNICYDKQIINSKKYLKFGERIDDILKYTLGWLKSICK